MFDELYELKDDLKNSKTGKEYLDKLISEYNFQSESRMKQNNFFYIVGAIEALYFSGKINQKEYTNYLKLFHL